MYYLSILQLCAVYLWQGARNLAWCGASARRNSLGKLWDAKIVIT